VIYIIVILLNIKILQIYSIYIYTGVNEAFLEGLKIDKKFYNSAYLTRNTPSLYYLDKRITIIYYSPTIISRIISKYAYGLAGGKEEELVDFNAHTDMSGIVENRFTTLILRPI
jgi:hypothetical protein